MHVQGFLGYVKIRDVILLIFFLFLSITQEVSANTIYQYSDRLSDSAPSESANHTINFRLNDDLPPGGTITFTPEPGKFEIPATDFDIDNVALYTSSGGSYTLRTATDTASAIDDGVSITTGTSGQIVYTLNSSTGIPADRYVRILLGSHTPNGTSTDPGITNPATEGNYYYYITTNDGVTSHQNRGNYAIIQNVHVGDVDTKEFEPPVRFNGAPADELSGSTEVVQMSLETNEFAICRYSTVSGTPYYSMTNEFGTQFAIVHVKNITVTPETSYTFYIRCIDDEGNLNTDDYVISFSIRPFPVGDPGTSGEGEGNGAGVGGGEGEADPGQGDPSGGTDTSGGSSGGGSGGGGGSGSGASSAGSTGGGGFEGSDKPYQSGDGRVIINGYAFPRSKVVILVDGTQVDEVTSSGDGQFSVTIDEIARGAYTFGVYGIDKDGVKSSTFSTTFSITGSRGSTLSNINVMPSIKVSPNPVDPDSTVKFSGYSIPNATVTIENQNDKSSVGLKTFTATSDSSGAWSVDVSTQGFSKGTYKVRAKAKQESSSVSTNFSGYTYYGVGQAAAVPRTSDLNRDGKVNLIDFSILLFWWNTNGGNSNPPADINGDGKVSLTDFSIMVFNWTG